MSPLLSLCVTLACLSTTIHADGMFDNIVNSFFGGEGGGQQQMQRRGRGNRPRTGDARMEISIPLKELYLGSQREISYQRNVVCQHCAGTGAKGGETKQCRKCKGQGSIIENVQVMPGFRMQQQKTCPVCGGKGQQYKHKCHHCRGQGVHSETTTLDIDIEKGMRDGQEIRFTAKSEERPGHDTGDLIAVVRQEKHRYFEREGDNLRTAVDLSLSQALLGFDLSIHHLDEALVPLQHMGEVTQHEQVRRYRGKGMPVLRRAKRHGDMLIEFRLTMPQQVTAAQRMALLDLFPEMNVRGEQFSR